MMHAIDLYGYSKAAVGQQDEFKFLFPFCFLNFLVLSIWIE